jgi:formylglycine-generating enzyme required for sulfatase activity
MPVIDGKLCVVDEARGVPRAVHPLVLNRKDGSVLVEVPAGEFEMGDGGNRDCPKHRVYLDRYWIGVCCVTNRQYGQFVRETGHRAPEVADHGEAVWKGGRCPEEKLDHPVVCVSWEDAAAYCQWAGGALPSEAQWERAARGPLGSVYPWGNEWDGRKCEHAVEKSARGTAAVYEYGVGASGWGTYNQSGNVWEWCADWYDEGYYGKGVARNPTGPASGSNRVRRGGGWGRGIASSLRGAFRFGDAPAGRYDYVGFRLLRAV